MFRQLRGIPTLVALRISAVLGITAGLFGVSIFLLPWLWPWGEVISGPDGSWPMAGVLLALSSIGAVGAWQARTLAVGFTAVTLSALTIIGILGFGIALAPAAKVFLVAFALSLLHLPSEAQAPT